MAPDDSSLTYEGKPIKTYLKKKRDEEVNQELKDLLYGDAKEKSAVIDRSIKPKYPDAHEDNGEVKHLTKREIREEYGPMNLPYNRDIDNIIYVIVEQGPLDAIDLAKALGWTGKHSTMSARLTTLWKRLRKIKPPIILRYKDYNTKTYVYCKANDKINGKDAVKIYGENKWAKQRKGGKSYVEKTLNREESMVTGKYDNAVDNILYSMVELETCTIRDLFNIIDWKGSMSSLSSRVSIVWKNISNLDPPIMRRYKDPDTKGFVYQVLDPRLTGEEAVQRLMDYNTEQSVLERKKVEEFDIVNGLKSSSELDEAKDKEDHTITQEEIDALTKQPKEDFDSDNSALAKTLESEGVIPKSLEDTLESFMNKFVNGLTTNAETPLAKVKIDVDVNVKFRFGD